MPSKRNNWGMILGLTGGMGTGKSTVLAMFKKKGAFTLDADAIVHQLLAKDRNVLSQIKTKFGADVFSKGMLNKKALAKIVFASKSKKKTLEKILHPRVRETIARELKRKSGKVAVLDIPLLYESGHDYGLDKVVVVTASRKNQLARLKARGVELADAKKRLAMQWPLKRKERRADFVVNNNGSKTLTQKQIDQIWKRVETGGM